MKCDEKELQDTKYVGLELITYYYFDYNNSFIKI